MLKAFTDEHRKNLSIAHIGNKHTDEQKRKCSESLKEFLKNNPRKPITEEVRKKMRVAKLGKKMPWNKGEHCKGEKNWQWIKNRTLLKDDHKTRGGQLHREWSKTVKHRDGWKCKTPDNQCKGKIISHHILVWRDYPDSRYDVNNGISLCHFHHPHKAEDEKRLAPIFMELVSVSKE